ncbi:LysR family transcriptional regulator substrate-binding protein [Klebsiella sp. WOUb02]|uniref:LysR family transcriptional regulator substrate-binding protein n=1 Tax=Klebsiella sp. WOUb02 TaxID=3161071 RepID=UPI003CE87D84
MALPQPRSNGVKIDAWRRDPVVAFLPAGWSAPDEVTAEWISAKPLVLNGSGTHLSQLTSGWFAETGHSPAPRITLDYNDAIKSLVGAGYGATLLPLESGTQTLRRWPHRRSPLKAGAVERAGISLSGE